MKDSTLHVAVIFVGAFFVRGIAAVVNTLTTLNPNSTADAVGFAKNAELIAQGIQQGSPYLYTPGSVDLLQVLVPIVSVDIYTLWGTFLAPFWLLPGPSGFYARLANAFLGVFAIYNVYLITRYYHSHHAGIIASLPMLFYPSVIAIQSTLLREALVLFGITTAARLLLLSSKRWSSPLTVYVLAAISLHVALLQRTDNLPIFVAAIVAALLIYAVQSGILSRRTIGSGLLFSSVVFLLSLPIIRDAIEYLAYIRDVRARGRAVYLPEVIPDTVFELIAFSWVGAVYFLYSPFPWMVETIPDLLISIEGLVNLSFTIAAGWGIRSLGQKNAPATVGLLVGLAVAVVLYGVGTANYGTGMRHRQMFLWVIFLFGGIGISEHVKFRWPFRWGSDASSESSTQTSNSKSD